MDKELKEILKRTEEIGTGFNGCATFNLHHLNGKTNVVSLINQNGIFFKYEHFNRKKIINFFLILEGNFQENTFKCMTRDKTIKLTKEEFLTEINSIYSLIEEDPDDLTYLVDYELFQKYKSIRSEMDSMVDKPYDWESEEMLDLFNQDLWESAEEWDTIDISIKTFKELNRLYERTKKGHSKPQLRIAK